MTTETPKKKPGLFRRMLAAPRSWTTVTWATITLTLFLVAAVITSWCTFAFGYDHVPWRHYMTWPNALAILTLLIITPIVFHKTLKLWLEGESARFKELERSWHAGINALAAQDITLDATPLFVVLGSNSEQQERAMMNTTESPLSVVGVPKGPAPLHWYGNSEAVYLFCSDASWLSSLNQLRKSVDEEADAVADALAGIPQDYADPDFGSPVFEGAEQSTPTPAAPPTGNNSRGTIMLDQFVGADDGPAPAGAAASQGSQRGTMVFDQPIATPSAVAAPVTPTPRTNQVSSNHTAVVLPARDATICQQKLQNVSQLLRNSRQPFCPINGVVTLLPFGTIDATGSELEELERAIRTDLAVLQRELKLRAPVTALVVGLEDEPGFRELVRRVGRDKSASQRFGGRFDVRAAATSKHLRSFSAHVCGAFEDWVYTLFREQGALSRPGNPRLYSLLCKVRCILKSRLGMILAKGYGYDDEHASDTEPHLFSGCYFASAGRTPDRQAFVRGVLEKLVSEQEQIEWTNGGLAQDQRLNRIFWTGIGVNIVLAASLAALCCL